MKGIDWCACSLIEDMEYAGIDIDQSLRNDWKRSDNVSITARRIRRRTSASTEYTQQDTKEKSPTTVYSLKDIGFNHNCLGSFFHKIFG